MANLSQLALNGTTYDLQAKDYTSSGGIATALGNKLGKSDKAASATTADTATKATTAQNYDSSTGNIKSTFDTVNNTLKTLSDGKQDKGDYAKKTADDLNTMINNLPTATGTPTDNDYFVAQYAGGGTSETSYRRRTISALWGYIKDKISSVLGLKADSLSLKGKTTDDPSYSGNCYPRITLKNSDEKQNGALIWTDYDSYRKPAGLVLSGNQGNEWFEAPAMYAKTFNGDLKGSADKVDGYHIVVGSVPSSPDTKTIYFF